MSCHILVIEHTPSSADRKLCTLQALIDREIVLKDTEQVSETVLPLIHHGSSYGTDTHEHVDCSYSWLYGHTQNSWMVLDHLHVHSWHVPTGWLCLQMCGDIKGIVKGCDHLCPQPPQLSDKENKQQRIYICIYKNIYAQMCTSSEITLWYSLSLNLQCQSFTGHHRIQPNGQIKTYYHTKWHFQYIHSRSFYKWNKELIISDMT
jgi:hypothetical protein